MKTDEKRNFQMYQKIADLYKGETMEYDVINKIFDLESRTEQDLNNLREYIVAVTSTDERFDLMTMLTQAIDSVLVMMD